jgi:hypothetical protein
MVGIDRVDTVEGEEWIDLFCIIGMIHRTGKRSTHKSKPYSQHDAFSDKDATVMDEDSEETVRQTGKVGRS